MHRSDATAIDILGESVLDHLYGKSGINDLFDRTLYTSPALFMQQYALARALADMGIEPDLVMGASLGEFVTAAVSGALSAGDAFRAVIRQAQDIEKRCDHGGMLAILDDYKLYGSTPILYENCTLAGVNYDAHFAVSGSNGGLKRISLFLKDKNIAFISLPVSHGFHSHLIDPAKASFTRFLKTLSYDKPEIPFISCSRAHPIGALPSNYLWDVIREPILFMKTVRNLEKKDSYIYLDLGPSGTLANFVKQNLARNSESSCMALALMFFRDRVPRKKAWAKLCSTNSGK